MHNTVYIIQKVICVLICGHPQIDLNGARSLGYIIRNARMRAAFLKPVI